MSKLRDIFFNDIPLRSDKWDPYFDVYETYFSKFINKSPVVVEVGIQGGGSLQMWKKFFGDSATIIGIDVDEEVKKLPLDGVEVVIGDQSDSVFWQKFLIECPVIDVFIDDGGHTMNQQIVTLLSVWPHISDNGVFVCEDTHTSYWEQYGGGLNNSNSFIEFSKNIIDIIHAEHINMKPPEALYQLFYNLKSISFYDSQVVLQKGKTTFKRHIVND
jgi:hypothetical protein